MSLGLCEKCKPIGLEAGWYQERFFVATNSRCDNCGELPRTTALTVFRATRRDLDLRNEATKTSEVLQYGKVEGKVHGDLLYCVAYERRLPNGRWQPETLYLHAASDGDARLMFLNSDDPITMGQNRIVGIAPAIGWFVDDEKNEKLAAE